MLYNLFKFISCFDNNYDNVIVTREMHIQIIKKLSFFSSKFEKHNNLFCLNVTPLEKPWYVPPCIKV